MTYYGIYYVDATDRDGWTDETLAEALKKPLAVIGIDVGIEKHFAGKVFLYNVEYEKFDTIRKQIAFIIAIVITQKRIRNLFKW